MQLIIVDRSRREAFHHCPRRRWWEYEYQGRGLSSVKPSAPLEIGKAVHVGIADLLKDGGVDTAVAAALDTFRMSTVVGIYDITGQPEDTTEAQALIEAQLRAWAIVRLPRWLEEFAVVQVEQEEEVHLGDAAKVESLGAKLTSIILLTRSDAIVRRKADGTLFLINFKTAKEINQLWRDQWRYDAQTFSEVLPIEARLDETLGGVIVEGLIKGSKSRDGTIIYGSPLIWPWKKSGEAPFSSDAYSGRYEWIDESGKNRRLGHRKTAYWKKVPIWKEPMGIAGWIAQLARDDRALLEEQFVTLPPILRSSWEIENWRRATIAEEVRIQETSQDVQSGEQPEDIALDHVFTQHTSHGNCLRPSKCSCHELCWGTAASDPIGSGLYRWREPNHPKEGELKK